MSPLKHALPPILYAATIFVASSLPAPNLAETGLAIGDKLVHALIFAGLAFLTARSTEKIGERRSLRRAVVVGIVLATLYGATDELHQSMVPSRHADWFDLLADGIGAILGGAGYGWWMTRRKRTDHSYRR